MEILNMRRIAVHCDTQEKAKALLKELEKYNVRWEKAKPEIDYNTDTCYAVSDDYCLKNCTKSYYLTLDFKILEFEDLLEKEEESNNCDDLAARINNEIEFLIDYANREYGAIVSAARNYRDGYIDGCKNSMLQSTVQITNWYTLVIMKAFVSVPLLKKSLT